MVTPKSSTNLNLCAIPSFYARSVTPLSKFPEKELSIYSLFEKQTGKALTDKVPTKEIILWAINQKDASPNAIEYEDTIGLILDYCLRGDIQDSDFFFQLIDGKLIYINRKTKSWMAIYYAMNKTAKFQTIMHLRSPNYHDGGHTKEILLSLYAENPSCTPEEVLFFLMDDWSGKFLKLSIAQSYCRNKSADMSVFSKMIDESDHDSPLLAAMLEIIVKSKKCTKEIIKKMLDSPNEEIQKTAMKHRFGKQYSCFR